MGEWKKSRLGDYIKVKHGFAFPGKYITTEETDDILVTPGNFNIGGGFKNAKMKYFKGEYPDEYILKYEDIIVTMTDLSKETDTLGYSAKIPKNDNKRYLHNQRIGLIQFKNDDIDKEFLYWLMRTREYHWYIVGSASGTSIMHTSPTRIEDYTCTIPPLQEQKTIAEVLSSLDDKIDLLHRQNKTLEALAQTLFRQWFIEEAGDEWEECKLGDVLEIKYGKDHKKLSDGNIPVYGSGGIIRYVDSFLYDKESILIPRKGTLSNLFYIDEPFWTVDTIFWSKIDIQKVSSKFIYFLLKTKDLSNLNVGSAVPSLTTKVLNEILLSLPPLKEQKKFNDYADNAWEKIKSNQQQIKTLENMRDTLLSKLMSRKARIEI